MLADWDYYERWRPHKKQQTRILLTWGQRGLDCPVLVATWLQMQMMKNRK